MADARGEAEPDADQSDGLTRIIQQIARQVPSSAALCLTSGSDVGVNEPTPVVFTPSHESLLLREAYDITLPSGQVLRAGGRGGLKPCCRGDECIGMSPSIRKAGVGVSGIVLMQALTPSEYRRAHATGLPGGGAPRMCVLCSKRQFIEMSDSWVNFPYCSGAVNWFVNPTDPEAGESAFDRRHCYPPEGHVRDFRLFIGRIAMVLYHKLRLEYDPDLECWRVNQDALLASPDFR